MRKLIASERVTLDGIFDTDTMGEWEDPYQSDARIEFLVDGILAADAFMLGRKTYQMLAPYWSSLKNNEMGIADKLNSAPKYIVSSSLKKAEWNNSTIIKENVVGEITRLKQQTGGNILIFGSSTLVHALLQANLIDELEFLVSPIIFGKGKRFFKDATDSSCLELIESKTIGKGVTLLRYKSVSQ